MDASALRTWCLEQTGASEEFPFGPEHSVFKVAGKIFALSALPARVRDRVGWAPGVAD
jgi:predicted DNA-binding protein (MmcQ/YjbR family)